MALGPTPLLQRQEKERERILTPEARSVRFSRDEIVVPDKGWRMWQDRAATWRDDTIYLPEDVVLEKVPVNAPTGGWSVLGSSQGISVALPAKVEQFFWGLQGFRPYKDEYKFEATDEEVKNGAYYGVSWWWRELEVPRRFAGKRVLLHVRGARVPRFT
ncbi:MAG TPA: hypothetical protein VFA99_17655 [Acidobacteriaceae bacterium]|nr:hypothetical protein [Acidobacteriaceae bacterium]